MIEKRNEKRLPDVPAPAEDTMKINDQELREWIEAHRDEMVRELMDYVRIPSVSRADLCDAEKKAPYGPDCRRMLDYALTRLADEGFRTEDHDGFCGSAWYGDAEEELGFVAHLDVVPEGEGWIYAPYEPVLKDGFMIGRGCDDNKSSAVIGLYLMKYLKEHGVQMKKSFRLMMGCAEETGMADFRHYLASGGKAPEVSIIADGGFPVCYAQKGGWNMDIAIPAGKDILDFTAGNVRNAIPDRAEIVLAADCDTVKTALSGCGKLEFVPAEGGTKITAHGKGGHAAHPEESDNAVVVLAKALAESGLTDTLDLAGIPFIAETFRTPYGDGMGFACEDEISGYLTSNIGVIRFRDGVIHALLDCRYPVKAPIQEMTDRFAEKLHEAGVTVEKLEIEKPFYIDPETPVVKTLQKVYRDITGDEKEPYSMGGGTYSRVIPNGITFGGGLPAPDAEFLPDGHGSCHGPDEVKHIDTWLRAFEIYLKCVLELCA